jgi:hypothetical protein
LMLWWRGIRELMIRSRGRVIRSRHCGYCK